jgi:predicted small lipoprotein YifL
LDRRQFSLLALAAGLAAGMSACGRRGPLEPPPYTAQGQAWNRSQGRNPDGTRKQPGQEQSNQQAAAPNARQNDDDQKGTVDIEEQVERNRTEGQPAQPSDPVRTDPGQQAQPSVSPTGIRRRPPGIIPPNRPFILDGLLE